MSKLKNHNPTSFDSSDTIDIHEKYRAIELLLSKLNHIGVALSIEKDTSLLIENILVASKEMTNAEGGTYYLYDRKNKVLKFEIMINDVLKTHYGGSGHPKLPFPPLKVYKDDGSVNDTLVAAYSAGFKKKVNIVDAYTVKGFDFSGTKKFDQSTGYRSKSFLTLPMVDAKDSLLGVLQLINPHHRNGEERTFNDFDEEMVESLTSQASVALSNKLLLDETKELFESMIKVINLALDEKSPYTNEHCRKVPVITMMIAEALLNNDKGILRDFYLDDDGKNELRIAALLHDCGKIVTPVHVIDKSMKLELLIDTIELIEAKVELILKDLDAKSLKNKTKSSSKVDEEKKALLDDFAFIRLCNNGDWHMHEKHLARLKQIAKKWSYKNSHGVKCPLLTPHQLELLSILRGTLSKNEREIINYHVTASIKMLEQLPWPENLKRVPEYAGGHHERMDGKGYPKGLKGSEMSIPARIMAVADIFEALTAVNRPYKKPQKLSDSLKIMDQLVLNGHLDPDIYDVFINQKVYLEYAKNNMRPDYIDIDDYPTIKTLNS